VGRQVRIDGQGERLSGGFPRAVRDLDGEAAGTRGGGEPRTYAASPAEASDIPAGSAPAATLQVNGPGEVPLVMLMYTESCTPTIAVPMSQTPAAQEYRLGSIPNTPVCADAVPPCTTPATSNAAATAPAL
jgi:hypothetical protein